MTMLEEKIFIFVTTLRVVWIEIPRIQLKAL